MTKLLNIANRTATTALHIAKITKNTVNTKKKNKYQSPRINNYIHKQNKPVNNISQYDEKIEVFIEDSRNIMSIINIILYSALKTDLELIDKDLTYILENKYDYHLVSETIDLELRDDLDQLLTSINKNVTNQIDKNNYIKSIESIQVKLDKLLELFQKVSINETMQKLENKIKQNELYQAKLASNIKKNKNQIPWFRNISGTKKKEINTNYNVKLRKLNSTITKSKRNLARLKNTKKKQQNREYIQSIIKV